MEQFYIALEGWFADYVMEFSSDEPAYQRNIELKRAHSYEVMANMATLSKRLNLSEDEQTIARIIGLLHDIGRFEQFKRYHTFYDKVSVDHAELWLEVLHSLKILDSLDLAVQGLILTAIKWHNKKTIPQDLAEDEALFCRMIRDADKLDIWRVVTNYYCNMDKETNNTLQLDLPDTPGYQEVNIKAIRQHEIVDNNHLKNLNDFKLMQVGWVFDLNFDDSVWLLNERNYMQPLFAALPEDENIRQLKNEVETYMEQVINSF